MPPTSSAPWSRDGVNAVASYGDHAPDFVGAVVP